MNSKQLKQFFLATGIGALGTLSMQAQHAQSDEIIDLETYTVTSSRMELELGKVGASMTILDTADIQGYEAAMATDVIRHVPGIYVRNSGGLGNSSGMSMRGIPVSPLVLIDGVEVNGPTTGAVFNFGNLPTQAISRIEVLRGAQSSLYGANALTGVISVSTKNAVEGLQLNNVGASYGSHNTVSAYATTSGDVDWMDYSVILNTYTTDGFSSQPEEWGEEWADDDGHDLTSFHGRFGFDILENLQASLIVHYHDAKSEYDPGTPSPWSTPISDNYTNEDQLLVKAEVCLQATEQWDVCASFTYNELDSFTHDAWGSSDAEAELNKLDLVNNFKFREGYVALIGAEIEEAADGIGNNSYETTSVFTEHVYDINETLTVTAGARVDDNDAYGSETTWRTSFAYNVADTDLKLRGSYGTGFDAPEIAQLFGAWGNPDLQAETGSSYDIGIEWIATDGLVVGVNYFDIDVEDKTEFLRSTFSYANVDWTSSGIEAFIEYQATEDTKISASYSYADAKRERVADDLILHSPEGMFSVNLDQQFLSDKLNVRVTGQYVDEREAWEGPADSFFTVDIAASYNVNEAIKVWVRADNLLDEEYQEILNYNGAPQDFSVGFNLAF